MTTPQLGPIAAACVLLVRHADGKLIGASRRNSPRVWGLPGGKVEPNERPIDAASRELNEETGVNVAQSQLRLLFVGDDDTGITVATYLYIGTVNGITPQQMDAEINVDWISWEDLLEGPFKEYNQHVYEKYVRNDSVSGKY